MAVRQSRTGQISHSDASREPDFEPDHTSKMTRAPEWCPLGSAEFEHVVRTAIRRADTHLCSVVVRGHVCAMLRTFALLMAVLVAGCSGFDPASLDLRVLFAPKPAALTSALPVRLDRRPKAPSK